MISRQETQNATANSENPKTLLKFKVFSMGYSYKTWRAPNSCQRIFLKCYAKQGKKVD